MTAAAGETGIRVLIADDVAEFRTLLRVTLVLDGRFELAGEAGDGAETVELAAAQQPDVILLDLSMPVMDGLEVIPELRRRAPDAKIVVLSGFMASRLGVDVIERGAHAYVEKGADAEELVRTLVDLCRPSRRAPAPRSAVPRLTGLDLWRAADGDVLGGGPGSATQPAPQAAPERPAEAVAGVGEEQLRRRVARAVAAMQGLVATLAEGVERLPADLVRDCVAELAGQLAALEVAVRPEPPAGPAPAAAPVGVRSDEDLSTLVREVVADVAARSGTVPPTVSELASVTASVDGERIRMILRGLLEHAGARGSEGTGATVSLDHVGSSVEIAVAGATDGGLRRRHPPDDVDVLPLEDLRAAARAHGGDLLSVPRASGVEFVLRLPVP